MRKLLAAAVLSLLVAACGGGGDAGKSGGKKPMFPVEVIAVEGQNIEYAISAVGTVEAFETVLVTARVRGVIEKVNFREGQEVKPDEVLLEIEPQTYRNALDSAKARLQKADAAQADAEFGLNKREEANAKTPGIFSPEEVETWRNKAKGAKAETASAKVDVAQADLDLQNSFAKAPIGGVIQTRNAQTGAYVQPGALLATLQRRDPLLVRFAVTEQEAGYLSISKALTFVARDTPRPLNAKITYIAAAADVGSRMVEVLSEVDAKDREFVRPGSFAQVRVVTGSKANTPAIPQTAVRPSERGFLAYVIENGVAKERVLTLGLRTDDGRVEVREGLKVGEKLVVRGGEALRDGVGVVVTMRKQDKPAANEDESRDSPPADTPATNSEAPANRETPSNSEGPPSNRRRRGNRP